MALEYVGKITWNQPWWRRCLICQRRQPKTISVIPNLFITALYCRIAIYRSSVRLIFTAKAYLRKAGFSR